MADVYEQNLASKSTLTTTDYIRVVGSDNVSYKQLVSDVAKKIIENYEGSTLAGSAQSVKSAVDSLNSKSNGELTTNADWYKVGNVMVVSLDNFSITNTSAVTLIGTLPSGYHPPVRVYASGFASGVVSYIRVDTDGKVYGYRSVAGNLLASITFPLA